MLICPMGLDMGSGSAFGLVFPVDFTFSSISRHLSCTSRYCCKEIFTTVLRIHHRTESSTLELSWPATPPTPLSSSHCPDQAFAQNGATF